MSAKYGRISEVEIGLATLQIAAKQPNGIATFHRLRKEIPDHVNLSDADHQQSITRPREELWEQIVRNIKSHYQDEGNIICEGYADHVPRSGYRITDNGRCYLENKSL